jgi:hypothetical protein
MIYTTGNGTVWYLHQKEIIMPRNKIKAKTYYFKKEKTEGFYPEELPYKYTVIETKSGMPMIKKR